MAVTEHIPGVTNCTAVISLGHNHFREVPAPISIGYYEGTDEVFIECEGQQIDLPGEHFDAIIKQLRRANKIALKAGGGAS